MAVGERSASWIELTDGTYDDGDNAQRGRESDTDTRGAPPGSPSDWGRLFGFTAIMTIPFGLVAWLMS
ncbi:MAG: hypothetical protein QE484_07765 [Rhizobium sp.]|nr:hypothetical protein [Rhizobium sp.]